MYKIGILGSDNSHALHFAKILNLPDGQTGDFRFPGFEVTHIFGLNEQETADIAEKGNIKYIAASPDELIGKVDAVMIVFRHGDLHLKYALPFVEAGLPVFLDKPFTTRIDHVKEILESASKSGAIVTGGSTLKYADDFVELKKRFDADEFRNTGAALFVTGQVSYVISQAPEYGGIHFYGPHTVEPALSLFGYDVETVYASRTDKNVLAILKYPRFQITLNFMYLGSTLTVDIFRAGIQTNNIINADEVYVKGIENFIEVIRNGKSDLSPDQILMPVAVLNAVERSLACGREINVKELILRN